MRSPRRSGGKPTAALGRRPATADGGRRDRAGRPLTLELAQELDRLAPFGLGNPEPTLLVASVEAAPRAP